MPHHLDRRSHAVRCVRQDSRHEVHPQLDLAGGETPLRHAEPRPQPAQTARRPAPLFPDRPGPGSEKPGHRGVIPARRRVQEGLHGARGAPPWLRRRRLRGPAAPHRSRHRHHRTPPRLAPTPPARPQLPGAPCPRAPSPLPVPAPACPGAAIRQAPPQRTPVCHHCPPFPGAPHCPARRRPPESPSPADPGPAVARRA